MISALTIQSISCIQRQSQRTTRLDATSWSATEIFRESAAMPPFSHQHACTLKMYRLRRVQTQRCSCTYVCIPSYANLAHTYSATCMHLPTMVRNNRINKSRTQPAKTRIANNGLHTAPKSELAFAEWPAVMRTTLPQRSDAKVPARHAPLSDRKSQAERRDTMTQRHVLRRDARKDHSPPYHTA